jgi:CRP-like cAMP-binding protein
MKIDIKNDSYAIDTLLDEVGVKRRTDRCDTGAIVYAQGAPASAVYCIVSGAVKLSIVSSAGREAVVAMLESGDFFGEGCLAGQKLRLTSAKTLMPTVLWRISKAEMLRALHERPDFSDRFLKYVLMRSIRIEEDLVNQLFNSTEKRLARTLLLLAENDPSATTEGKMAKVPQGMLAELVGTTRPRVNFFLNKFRKQGLIEYNGGLKVNKALLSAVLRRE